jgi:hypothetical protein
MKGVGMGKGKDEQLPLNEELDFVKSHGCFWLARAEGLCGLVVSVFIELNKCLLACFGCDEGQV